MPGKPQQRNINAVIRALITAGLGVTAGCAFLPISRMSTEGVSVIERAPKPDPVDSAFGDCGPAGSQPDYVLNRRKNRVDTSQYLPIDWKVVARLPFPRRVGYRFRNQWTAGETAAVARYEGAPVQISGYLVGYRLEVPEPPNCYATDARGKDYHLWLSEVAHGRQKSSVVVEVTPRVRVSHPGWTEARLAALVETQAPLRVSGWLMLDQMHPEKVGGNRITLWEVHPIMRLDWQDADGHWVSLDSAGPESR